MFDTCSLENELSEIFQSNSPNELRSQNIDSFYFSDLSELNQKTESTYIVNRHLYDSFNDIHSSSFFRDELKMKEKEIKEKWFKIDKDQTECNIATKKTRFCRARSRTRSSPMNKNLNLLKEIS